MFDCKTFSDSHSARLALVFCNVSSSFTASTTDVLINATDYDTAGNTIAEKTGTYVRSGSTITATVSSGHNLPSSGTQYITIDFAGSLHGTIDDNLSFQATYVNSTVFTTTSTSGSEEV